MKRHIDFTNKKDVRYLYDMISVYRNRIRFNIGTTVELAKTKQKYKKLLRIQKEYTNLSKDIKLVKKAYVLQAKHLKEKG